MSATKNPHVFTVDLEDWYQGIEIDIDNWGEFTPRIRNGLDPLLDMLQESNTKATFFVLGFQAEKTPDLIRKIADLGHDIASHGYSHRFVYQQEPARFQAELRRSKVLLEDICGQPVTGYRAPFFSITQQSLWALDILLEEGFLYDSSLFPVNNYRYGIPGAKREAGWLMTPSGNRIFEIPLSTVRLPSAVANRGRNVPMSGGGYFRLYPYRLTHWLIKRLEAEKSGLVFYMHPWEYDPDHPRISFPRRFPQFTHYYNLHGTAEKTRKLLNDFSFTTVAKAYSSQYSSVSWHEDSDMQAIG